MTQNFTSSAPSLMKQVDSILYQNKEENHKKVRCGIQKKGRRKDESEDIVMGEELASGPRKQLIKPEARKRMFQGKIELKDSLMCLAI